MRCVGNFPSVCKSPSILRRSMFNLMEKDRDKVFPMCYERYPMGAPASCPDRSDEVYCADTVNCEQHGLFRFFLQSQTFLLFSRYVVNTGAMITRLASQEIFSATATDSVRIIRTNSR